MKSAILLFPRNNLFRRRNSNLGSIPKRREWYNQPQEKASNLILFGFFLLTISAVINAAIIVIGKIILVGGN